MDGIRKSQINNNREYWECFIREHKQRFLYALGGADWKDSLIKENEVSDFLVRLKNRDIERSLLACIYHLTRDVTFDFFSLSLPALLRCATHVSTSRSSVSRQGARGKINWPNTYRVRHSGRIDSGAFSVSLPRTSNDVPENRLLKLYLSKVVDTVTYLISEYGSEAIPLRIKRLEKLAIQALKEPFIRDIPLEKKTSARMRRRACRNRNRLYRELLLRQEELEEAIYEDKWATILKLMEAGWLAPISDDDLFELYTLVLILDILENDIGLNETMYYGLIRPHRKEVAELKRGGVSARIYFDQNPGIPFEEFVSEYVNIINSYNGLPYGISPRPDLIILINTPSGEKRLIVEVKETQDDKYMRGSIYKVLGYLSDFKGIWAEKMVEQKPKALLVFPESVLLKDNIDESKRDLVVSSVQDRKRISHILTCLIDKDFLCGGTH